MKPFTDSYTQQLEEANKAWQLYTYTTLLSTGTVIEIRVSSKYGHVKEECKDLLFEANVTVAEINATIKKTLEVQRNAIQLRLIQDRLEGKEEAVGSVWDSEKEFNGYYNTPGTKAVPIYKDDDEERRSIARYEVALKKQERFISDRLRTTPVSRDGHK